MFSVARDIEEAISAINIECRRRSGQTRSDFFLQPCQIRFRDCDYRQGDDLRRLVTVDLSHRAIQFAESVRGGLSQEQHFAFAGYLTLPSIDGLDFGKELHT